MPLLFPCSLWCCGWAEFPSLWILIKTILCFLPERPSASSLQSLFLLPLRSGKNFPVGYSFLKFQGLGVRAEDDKKSRSRNPKRGCLHFNNCEYRMGAPSIFVVEAGNSLSFSRDYFRLHVARFERGRSCFDKARREG